MTDDTTENLEGQKEAPEIQEEQPKKRGPKKKVEASITAEEAPKGSMDSLRSPGIWPAEGESPESTEFVPETAVSPFPSVNATIPLPKDEEEYNGIYPPGRSETAHGRPYLARYCNGLGLDIGFGGDAIVPWAITMDSRNPYTSVGKDRQILRGDAMDLSGFCDETLDFVYSSHLIEDYTYEDQVKLIREWHRILKPGGYLVTNCPDQQRFEEHCARTGQGLNLAHKESSFSLENFKDRVLSKVGTWNQVYEKPFAGPYSWYLVVQKV